ncbi:MAG: DNA polymerase IV [Thermodesulfobacteriota bacterium]|nr:DNA polymerase IV [Thermodesulfobacteriota bacterium]
MVRNLRNEKNLKKTKERVILHVDMDAFFASVEQQTNPTLKGKPIAVCGSKERTVVSAASYEARPYGVKAGMSLKEAKMNCPDLILVEADVSKYVYTSTIIFSIFKDFTPQVEIYSIDEAFLDVTGCLLLFHEGKTIAKLIKEKIREELGITCSIGIAPNKLMAKLASEMKKPDGLTVITQEGISRILQELSVKEIPGIGKQLTHHLALLGIRTCGELGKASVDTLTKRFGIIGERLHKMGLGIDDSPVIPFEEEPEAKSVGHSMTIDQDIYDKEEIKRYILQLSEMVGRRLRKNHYRGRTVSLTLRYSDFHTFGKQVSHKRHTSESMEIYHTAIHIFDSIRLQQAVRLVGVKVSNLCKDFQQPFLFPRERRKHIISQVMDKVNDRYGEFTVTRGSLLECFRHHSIIDPHWKPNR